MYFVLALALFERVIHQAVWGNLTAGLDGMTGVRACTWFVTTRAACGRASRRTDDRRPVCFGSTSGSANLAPDGPCAPAIGPRR
ncbi:hypothetical protein [Streptomyces heilongjiangensis]|uniref:Uncharacterized protein n=1 Tax=Streptomyces heilongjiangensis TaxID=945052 RepID=A0ABW1BK18_9ACTN|nr:hypothetical protein [Streptomyces heilongjiangensis]MDC2952105.1 hypothetical protein [Streptomyces heilongjiangensis]